PIVPCRCTAPRAWRQSATRPPSGQPASGGAVALGHLSLARFIYGFRAGGFQAPKPWPPEVEDTLVTAALSPGARTVLWSSRRDPAGAGRELNERDAARATERPERLSHPHVVHDPRGLVHLGHQHPVPGGRRAERHGGVCRERVLHGRHGAVRGADRRGRRHLGSPRLVPARRADADGDNRCLLAGLAGTRAVLGLGGNLDAARP